MCRGSPARSCARLVRCAGVPVGEVLARRGAARGAELQLAVDRSEALELRIGRGVCARQHVRRYRVRCRRMAVAAAAPQPSGCLRSANVLIGGLFVVEPAMSLARHITLLESRKCPGRADGAHAGHDLAQIDGIGVFVRDS